MAKRPVREEEEEVIGGFSRGNFQSRKEEPPKKVAPKPEQEGGMNFRSNKPSFTNADKGMARKPTFSNAEKSGAGKPIFSNAEKSGAGRPTFSNAAKTGDQPAKKDPKSRFGNF
mmetsp:Transcript_16380/g.27732  ORF Transcript_16380/g.27732 Transcript_16380/m.27732 type:complete len:114 (+) Transcript_16380:729-1070(+)